MSSTPPSGGPPEGPKPFPVPTPLPPEPVVEPEPPRPSAAELLPPADTSEHRVRHADRVAAEGRRRRARHGRRVRTHRSWPQRILLTFLVISVLATAGAASLVGFALYKYEQVERVEVALSAAPPGAPENYLIVGSDTRDTLEGSGLDEAGFTGEGAEGSGQRSDTIMVVRADPAQESVDILSLPRDLWLPIADTDRSQRINTAYAGGPQRLIDTIETNFDVPIHHYVEVDFAGFAGLVDAIGGVPMWFDAPMRDTHSGLRIEQAGCQVLDPQMALAFARARHVEYRTDDGWSVDGTADLGRITRQQVFLRRAMNQVRTLGIDDAGTLRRLVDVGIDSVSVDEGLGLESMLDLGRRFSAVEPEALRTYALPVYSYTTSGGASVLGLEAGQAQPILNIFRGLPVDTLAPVQVEHVTVLNGTGETGQAGTVADALDEVGFGIDGVGDVDVQPVQSTRIRHAPGAEAQADLLRRHLTSGAVVVVDPTLDDGEIVLETGMDFTTIGRRALPADPATSTTSSPSTSSSATSSSSSSSSLASGDTGTDETAPDTTTSTAAPGYAPDAEAACS